MQLGNDSYPSVDSNATQPHVRASGPTVVIPPVIDQAELRELYAIRELLTDYWPAFEAIVHELSWRQFLLGSSGLPGWSEKQLVRVTQVRELFLFLRPHFTQPN